MRGSLGLLVFAVSTGIAGASLAADAGLPDWAFSNPAPVPLPPPPSQKPVVPPPVDGTPKHVPGSQVGMTLAQVRDVFNVPDWHPDNHPVAPNIVLHGRKGDPAVMACGYCHLPNGLGRPENASLAGLPAAYIVQQIADLRSGARASSDPKLMPPVLMDSVAKAVTDDEVKVAADYFSGLEPRPWIRVVEAATVPKTHVAGYMLVPDADGGTEPIGQRIVETPENPVQTELRDSGSGFVAYVPPGSIARGQKLTSTGGGRTIPCGNCHGADLKGLGPVPRLAGRSPSYIVRQLYDFQRGARAGLWSPLMQGVVRELSPADIVDIVAYTASRKP